MFYASSDLIGLDIKLRMGNVESNCGTNWANYIVRCALMHEASCGKKKRYLPIRIIGVMFGSSLA